MGDIPLYYTLPWGVQTYIRLARRSHQIRRAAPLLHKGQRIEFRRLDIFYDGDHPQLALQIRPESSYYILVKTICHRDIISLHEEWSREYMRVYHHLVPRALQIEAEAHAKELQAQIHAALYAKSRARLKLVSDQPYPPLRKPMFPLLSSP